MTQQQQQPAPVKYVSYNDEDDNEEEEDDGLDEEVESDDDDDDDDSDDGTATEVLGGVGNSGIATAVAAAKREAEHEAFADRTKVDLRVKAFLDKHVYGGIKFANDDVLPLLVNKLAELPDHKKPSSMDLEDYRQITTTAIRRAYYVLRANSQKRIKRRFMTDYARKDVTDAFPGPTIRLTKVNMPSGRTTMTLNPDYRKLGKLGSVSKDLEYFVTRILPAVHPAGHDFDRYKRSRRLTEIFDVSDEAFALLVVYNESHIWIADAKEKLLQAEQEKQQQEEEAAAAEGNAAAAVGGKRKAGEAQQQPPAKKPPRPTKHLTHGDGGRHPGWSVEGLNLYNSLCQAIQKLRDDPQTGQKLEDRLKKRFARAQQKATPTKTYLSSRMLSFLTPAATATATATAKGGPTTTTKTEEEQEEDRLAF
eukprot:CAMPEP_0197180096 /NCGR_PEP_ID=MMETSP1423-20130617/4826_1 /TAXON_ID=476441 /ORGANISM="Pseudo-nitzschia heimii, Strain UNC1101" /LENGTH=420 /DNA_ID=CAMNT_0042630117 /DNA_START=267 /DNA_END=1529 /DNA_ORIENTATION=-